MSSYHIPKYRDLPKDPITGDPTAFGIFDEDGVKDELGTLNLLTSDTVLGASKEIRSGKSVSLNWAFDKLPQPAFGRIKYQHKLLDWLEKGTDFCSFDDEVTFNTQSVSQWDGLRHWGHSKTHLHYNGVKHEDIPRGSMLGIDRWDKRGGILGRGVLLDYCSWARQNGVALDAVSRHAITMKELEAVAEAQKVDFYPGDILVVRTGLMAWYQDHTDEERVTHITHGKAGVGVEASDTVLEWLWDHHFSAVASDSVGFEAWPKEGGILLHDHLLSLWGMPIGELWDLEALSEECIRQKRWSFFLTSSPLNITGGAASPPNAIAVF